MHFNPLNPNQANVVLDRYWKMFYSQTRDYEEEGMIMRNFIFISPHFPTNYENFCVRLHENGVNVFGIGAPRRKGEQVNHEDFTGPV